VCNPEAAGGDALKFIERNLDKDLREPFESAYVVPLCDLHEGDERFDEAKFLKYRDWILAEPNRFTVIAGDWGNYALKESKSNVYEQTHDTDKTMDNIGDLMRPLVEAKRILGVTEDGNHGKRVRNSSGILPMRRICRELGISDLYAGEGAFVKATLGKDGHGKRVCYTMYVTHGWGGGRRPGGTANMLEDMSRICLADCYIAGHTHKMLATVGNYYVPDLHNNNMQEVKQTYVSAGSFLKWGGYAEAAGYRPAKLGSPRIRLDGKRKDVHVSI
jgi:hypothetical protein